MINNTLAHKKIKIQVLWVSIVKEAADAIVVPANSNLEEYEGVCSTIFQACGPYNVQQECQNLLNTEKFKAQRKLQTSDVVMHKSFLLRNSPFKIQYIFHALGPVCKQQVQIDQDDQNDMAQEEQKNEIVDHTKEEEELFTCIMNILNQAFENTDLRINTISIPAISCGVKGLPMDTCARVVIDAILKYDQSKLKSIKTVKLINLDKDIFNSLLKELEDTRKKLSST